MIQTDATPERLAQSRLAAIPSVKVSAGTLLADHTRFGIGGPADLFAETRDAESFVQAMEVARSSGMAWVVLGGGTNVVVADEGFQGIVLRFVADRISADGNRVTAESGAVLQDLVDFTVERGLKGLETLAGIPGWVGAAIYGNAGAYGHSISERVRDVRFLDGAAIRVFTNAECAFRYRESVFKEKRGWIILSALLELEPADPAELRRVSGEILRVRNEKFPPVMKCAGSIFKNFLLAELPPEVAAQVPPAVIREGKVAAAYFLEQVGAKGMTRGDIHVASYHANLIYNGGSGTARDLCAVIQELKARVRARYGIEAEEEVQYVGY